MDRSVRIGLNIVCVVLYASSFLLLAAVSWKVAAGVFLGMWANNIDAHLKRNR